MEGDLWYEKSTVGKRENEAMDETKRVRLTETVHGAG
jgi:hypothetical protein